MRRNGDWAGSVSRMTRAATTRWTMNWYECSWSCRDGIRPPRVTRPHTAGDRAYDRPRNATRGGHGVSAVQPTLAPPRGAAHGRRVARPKRVQRRGTLLGLHSGQIVAAELAAALLLAGAVAGYVWLAAAVPVARSEEHTSELQSRPQLVCRLLLENKTAR